VWAGGLGLGLNEMDKRREGGDPEVAQNAADVGNEDDGGADGGADGGEAGADDDGAGGAEDGDGGGASVVQVSGTVDAGEPESVRVQIERVALTDARARDATFVSTVMAPPAVPALTKQFGRSAGLPAMAAPAVVTDPTADSSAAVVSVVEAGPRTTSTDADGRFSFADLRAPDFYLVTFSKPGYETVKYVVEATEGAPGIDLEVEMEAGTGVISGRVTDAGGTPLGGATIEVTDGELTFSSRTASTGDVGTYRIEGLSTPASYLVSASRHGYGLESSLVDLGGSGSASGVDLRLRQGVGAVYGRVTTSRAPADTTGRGNPDGRGLGGATVTVTAGEFVREVTTLTDGVVGSYTLPQLPIGPEYTLTVSREGFTTETRAITLPLSEPANVVINKSTATLTGTASQPDGRPIRTVGIALVSADQELRTTGPGSGFNVDAIPPGSYVATFESVGFRTRSRLVELGAGGSKHIDVPMRPAPEAVTVENGELLGRITDENDGKSVPADVRLRLAPNADGKVVTRRQQATNRGEFAFEELPPGIHTLRARSKGFERYETSVRVGAESTTIADFTMRPLASLEGTVVTDATNTPLVGAQIAVRLAGSPALVANTTSGADGLYKLQRIFQRGEYEITVTADEHDVLRERVVLEPPNTLTQKLRVPRKGIFELTLYEPGSGSAIIERLDGATVQILQGTTVVGTAVTGAPGSEPGQVTFSGLEAGAHVLEISQPGYYSASIPVNITKNLPSPQTGAIVIGKRQGTMSGRVTWQLDGVTRPVPAPELVVTYVNGLTIGAGGAVSVPTATVPVTGDADGNFSLDLFTSDPTGATGVRAISPTVSVQVSGTGFVPKTFSDVDSRLPFRPTLLPLPGRINATLNLVTGALPWSGPITATVTAKPAEAGVVVVTVPASGGALTIGDASYPDGTNNALWPGTYTIRFTHPSFDPAEMTFTLRENQTLPATATMVQHGQVLVTVKGGIDLATATDLTGARVTFRKVGSTTPTVRDLTGSTTTFTGLSPGNYEVSATRSGYADSGFQPVTVTAGTETTSTVSLLKLGSISGTLRGVIGTRPPAPLANVPVTLTGGSLGSPVVVTTTTTGRFSFTDLPPGTYAVASTPDGYEAMTGYGAVSILQGEDRELGAINVNAITASLTGVISVGGGGGPLEGVRVRLLGDEGSGPVIKETFTNAAGQYDFTGLAPITWTFAADKATYSPLSVALDLNANRNLTYNASLNAIVHNVSGKVVARYGAKSPYDLAGVQVGLTPLTPGGSSHAPVPTGSDGRFTFTNVRPGTYEVTFALAGFVSPPAQTVLVTDAIGGTVPTVTMDALARPVEITVTSSVDSSPIAARLVTLTAAGSSTGTTVTATTDFAGVARFPGAFPGSYTTTVAADAAALRPGASKALSIAPGTTTVADSVSVAEAKIVGTVSKTDENGAVSVVGERVKIHRLGSPTPAIEPLIDGSSAYAAYVEPGVGYRVTFDAGTGYPNPNHDTSVLGATTTTTVNITRLKFARLTVRVFDAAPPNAPINNGSVRIDPSAGTCSGGPPVCNISGGSNQAVITNLPPGNYTVTGIGPGNSWNDSPAVPVTLGPGADDTVDVHLTKKP
jgi:large repetitive protein